MARAVLATGNNGITLQLEYGNVVDAATGGSITNSTTSVRVAHLEAHLHTGVNRIEDKNNSGSASGNAIQARSWGNRNFDITNHSSQHITTFTPVTWALTFGSTSTRSITVTQTGLEYAGGTLSGSRSFTAPRRPYAITNPPSAVNIGDGTCTITGNQNNAAADRYWEFTDWQLSTNDGAWVNWATGSIGSRTSITYTPANDSRYRFRVRGRNSDSGGTWGLSAHYYTPIPGASGLTAARVSGSATQVRLNWTNNARYRERVRIGRSLNGGTWAIIGQVGGSETTYVDTIAATDSASYIVYTDTPQGTNRQTAGSNAATVGQGYTNPDRPNVTTHTINLTTGVATIRWNGNVTDSSDLKWWEFVDVEIEDSSGGLQARRVTGSTTVVTYNTVNNLRYAVRVRSVNPAGGSTWSPLTYVFSRHPAPTLGGGRVGGNSTTVSLIASGRGTWANNVRFQRLVNGSWQTVTTQSANLYTFQLPLASSGRYRVLGVTPDGAESPPSNSIDVDTVLVSNKSRIPGVTTIFHGTTRVHQAYAGANEIWVDGD